MTSIALVFAFLGACAWIAEYIHATKLQDELDLLRHRYAVQSADKHALERLLAQSLQTAPPYQKWPERKQQRLESHLQLVDEEPDAWDKPIWGPGGVPS